MSLLGLERATVVCSNGSSQTLCPLTEAGLDLLFRQGWEAVQALAAEPHAWFVAQARLRTDPVVAVADQQPFVVDQQRQRWLLYVHPGLRWFVGHFPGRPILPGVVQIGWAVGCAPGLGYPEARFRALAGVKFTRPLLPGEVVSLGLTPAGPARLAFSLESRHGVHSRGTLQYRD